MPRNRKPITPLTRLGLSCLMLSVVALWGYTFVPVKDGVAVYGVASFLAVRFLIGAFCIGVFCIRRPQSDRRMDRSSLFLGLKIGIVLGIAYLFQTFGLKYSTATNTALITGLFVMFAPLANRLFFGVKTKRSLWAAIAVSLIGLGLLTGVGQGGFMPGDLLTLGCAAAFGLHIALLDRNATSHNTTVLVLGQLLGASLLISLIAVATEPITFPPSEVWPALLLTGIGATAFGFFVQTFVQKRLSAIETAMLIFLEPMFGALFGYLLHHDLLNGWQMFGGCLVIAAIFFTEIYPLLHKRMKKSD